MPTKISGTRQFRIVIVCLSVCLCSLPKFIQILCKGLWHLCLEPASCPFETTTSQAEMLHWCCFCCCCCCCCCTQRRLAAAGQKTGYNTHKPLLNVPLLLGNRHSEKHSSLSAVEWNKKWKNAGNQGEPHHHLGNEHNTRRHTRLGKKLTSCRRGLIQGVARLRRRWWKNAQQRLVTNARPDWRLRPLLWLSFKNPR